MFLKGAQKRPFDLSIGGAAAGEVKIQIN